LFALVVAAFAANVPICLPKVHTAMARQYFQQEEERVPFPIPIDSTSFIQIWNDLGAQKSLFWDHEDEMRTVRRGGVLRDYNKKYEWRWEWDDRRKQVFNCNLFLMPPDAKDAQVCLLHNANLTRSGTLGKDFKVDWYTERGTDGVHDFEFVVTLESGSTELVVEERGMGFNRITGVSFYDSLQIYNMNTDPIDPKVFNVPQNCPL